jgi:hypothetical protein
METASFSASHYLVQALNMITERQLLGRSQEEIFTIGCNALSRLVVDDEFRDVMLSSRTPSSAAMGIISDVDHFVSGFLHIEEKLFLELGISAEATYQLIHHALALRTDLKAWANDGVQLLPALLQLREDICSVSRRPRLQSPPSFMSKVWYAVAGGTVIVVNVSAQAMHMLPDAGREVSIAYGGALIGRAMESAAENN